VKFFAEPSQRILGIELKREALVRWEGCRHKSAANVQRPTPNVQRRIEKDKRGSIALRLVPHGRISRCDGRTAQRAATCL